MPTFGLQTSASTLAQETKTSFEAELYLIFLRFLFVAFATWSCFHLLFLFLAISKGPTGALAATTGFNLGRTMEADDVWQIFVIGDITTTKLYTVLTILDSAGMFFFFMITTVFFYVVVPFKLSFFYRDKLKAGTLSIEIHGLPPRIDDHQKYEQHLIDHLSSAIHSERLRRKMPKDTNPKLIRECHLVRDYNSMLYYFKYVCELEEQRTKALEKGNPTKADKLTKKLVKLRAQHECYLQESIDRDVYGRAYVILDCVLNKEILKSAYPCSMFGFTSPAPHFRECPLRVTDAPDPDDILWENQDRRMWPTLLRKSLTVVVTLLLLGALFIVIFSMKIWALDLAEQRAGCLDIGNRNQLVEDWEKTLAVEGRTELTSCECSALGHVQILLDAKLYNEHCQNFVLLFFAAALSFTVVNIIVEVVLDFLMEKLTIMERPLRISHRNSSLCCKIFIVEWISTGLIIPLACSNVLYNYPFFRYFYSGQPSLTGYFDPEWYLISGQSIMLSQLGRAFHPHITYYIKDKVMEYVFPQKEDATEVRYFDIPVRMAFIMVFMALAAMYSASMPLMSLVATASFALVYAVDSRTLREIKMPPGNDRSVFEIFKGLYPLACLLHCVVAIMMFGNRTIFKIEDSQEPDSGSNDVLDVLLHRSMERLSWSSLCLLAFLLVLYFICFVKVGGQFIHRLVRDFLGKHIELPKKIEHVSMSATPDTHFVGLWTYAPENNPTYAPIIAMANNTQCVEFEKLRHQAPVAPVEVPPSLYFARLP